jgi:hypothetical protein
MKSPSLTQAAEVTGITTTISSLHRLVAVHRILMEKCLTLRKVVRILTSAVAPLPVSLSFSRNGFMQFSSSGDGNSDLSWLNQLGPERGGNSTPSTPPGDPHRNRRLGIIIAVSAAVIVCVGLFGLALYRAFIPSTGGNETESGGSNITCQELIDRALQASGDSCDQIGSNQVCYGNNTLTAELNSAGNFAQEGDVVSVSDLRRLAASPLSLSNEEWGIAVFKVLANLPRSLPGETITMVVFGNTTLDNPSNNLQTFYFSSTLGQILCDEVPFDGLMITMPDGAGVSFVINGAEMTLMGNASISATQNGSMEVSMYSGSAYISANGASEFVTAGESTSMDLGGPNGTSAVSPPSPPVPLSPEELELACTLTGQFCSDQEITPVSPGDAVSTLLAQLGVTPNPTATTIVPPTLTSSFTPSITLTPSLSATPSRTLTPSPTRTATPTPTRTRTATIATTRTQTTTPTRTRTATSTSTGTLTVTTTITPSPTASRTNTDTPTGTHTSTPTNTPTLTPTSTTTSTPTLTSTETDTPLPPTDTPSTIDICHCIDATTCNLINIPNTGSGGHWTHPFDIIPAPVAGCPTPSPTPSPTPP